MRACLIVILLLLQGLAVAAGTTIYRTTDADGNVVFTDNPPQERPSKTVKLKPTNAVPMAAPRSDKAASSDNAGTVKPAFQGYTDLRITSPEDGATIRNPQKPVSVKVQLAPSLQPGDQLRILDNGESQQGTGMSNPERGSHTLQAEVVDKDGDILIRSASITVYVHRTSMSQQSGGASGSGASSFGAAAHAGGGARAGGAAGAGGAASAGSGASFGHAASR